MYVMYQNIWCLLLRFSFLRFQQRQHIWVVWYVSKCICPTFYFNDYSLVMRRGCNNLVSKTQRCWSFFATKCEDSFLSFQEFSCKNSVMASLIDVAFSGERSCGIRVDSSARNSCASAWVRKVCMKSLREIITGQSLPFHCSLPKSTGAGLAAAANLRAWISSQVWSIEKKTFSRHDVRGSHTG